MVHLSALFDAVHAEDFSPYLLDWLTVILASLIG